MSLNFHSINTVIQGMKAKTGGNRERKYGKNIRGRAPKFSDEEDDALRDHDLVVILHLAQGSLNLC